MKKWLSFITFTLLLVVHYPYSDFVFGGSITEAEKAFNHAATMHRGEFKSLMKMRGISLAHQEASLETVLDKLQYLEDTVLLFYHHDNTSLRIWALSNQNIAWEETEITKQDVHKVIEGFRNELGSLGYQIERAPKPRGLSIIQKNSLTRKPVEKKLASYFFQKV
jgi:hypothetical protein